MVNKLWCREAVRKWWMQAKSTPPPPKGRCFTEPNCHESLRFWYLVYRWLIFTFWLLILICSVFELGSLKPQGSQEKWPIYLTNWDIALGLSQSLLGAILVTRRWRVQSAHVDFEPNQLEFGKLERVYWFLYIVTTSLALGVTVTYWSLVHDPRFHYVDALNIMIHVCNSLLVVLDFIIMRVPFELRSFWWCPALVVLYLCFSLIYYLAGGLDKRGFHRIYDVLDWEQPGRTLIICIGGITFLAIAHCLLCWVARLRDRAYDRRRNKSFSINGAAKELPAKNDSCV